MPSLITDIDDILPGLIEGRDRVYSAMGSNAEFDRHLMESDQRDPLQSRPRRPAAERIRCPGSSASRHAPV